MLFLAIAAVFSMAACGGAGTVAADPAATAAPVGEVNANAQTAAAAKTPWEDTAVRVAMDVDPGTFEPYESNNNGRKITLYSVYETLAAYQERGGEVKGIMAKNWYGDGEYTYVVELYDYIFDTEGNQITTDDVIYSFMDAGYETRSVNTNCHDFSTFDIRVSDTGSPGYIITSWYNHLSHSSYEDGLNYSKAFFNSHLHLEEMKAVNETK